MLVIRGELAPIGAGQILACDLQCPTLLLALEKYPVTVARALEFKGRMLTMTVLKISSADMGQIEQELATRVASAPDFFRGMPVLLDIGVDSLDMAGLLSLLRRSEMIPVALYQPNSTIAEMGRELSLGVLQDLRPVREVPAAPEPAAQPEPTERAAPTAPAEPVYKPTRVVREPVRSGQQIYARGGDLIVLAPVSAGAEVLADGNVHIYGALRGRALAGVQGDANARIFCQQLDAELVAVAGCYTVNEDIDPGSRGKSVQISLAGERLQIESN